MANQNESRNIYIPHLRAAPSGARIPPELGYDDSTPLLDKVLCEIALAEDHDAWPAWLSGKRGRNPIYNQIIDAVGGDRSVIALRIFRLLRREHKYETSSDRAPGSTFSGRQERSPAVRTGASYIRCIPFHQRMTSTLTAYVCEDVEVIGVLGRLATGASDPAVRDQAGSALQSSHTKETLPHFAAMLEQSDPAVRLRGVLGFSAFVYGLPAPDRSSPGNRQKPRPRTAYASSEEIARAHVPGREVESAQFWRVWWAQHRDEIMR